MYQHQYSLPQAMWIRRGEYRFLRNFNRRKIIIAEAACGDTQSAFSNLGYQAFFEEYDVELVDLNQDTFKLVLIMNYWLNALRYNLAHSIKTRAITGAGIKGR